MNFNDYDNRGSANNAPLKDKDDIDLWKSFAAVGRVEDYLRYKGIDIYTNGSAKQDEADNLEGFEI